MDDDIDIYGDLDNSAGDKLETPSVAAQELQQKNVELEKKIEELTNELAKLCKYTKLLEANISSLHKTAKVEISRKDRMIADLRQEVDNLAFRRGGNFRIPKKLPKPSVISLPPKEINTFTATIKQKVNDTIHKEETVFQSPLIEADDDEQDTEQIYQPEKIPMTVFGERLKKRLQQEALVEIETTENVLRKDQDHTISQNNSLKPIQNSEIPINTEVKVNKDVEIITIKDDQENQYRLIPLTLTNQSKSLRKKRSKSGESHDENHPCKRQKMNDNEKKKSPNVDENKTRLSLEGEYFCPSNQSINDDICTKRRYKIRTDVENNQKQKLMSKNSRSRSRSRSRNLNEKRRRSNSRSRVSTSLLDRRKRDNKRRSSKLPQHLNRNNNIDIYSLSRDRDRRKIDDSINKNHRNNDRDQYLILSSRKDELNRRLRSRNDSEETRRNENGIRIKEESRNYENKRGRTERRENVRDSTKIKEDKKNRDDHKKQQVMPINSGEYSERDMQKKRKFKSRSKSIERQAVKLSTEKKINKMNSSSKCENIEKSRELRENVKEHLAKHKVTKPSRSKSKSPSKQTIKSLNKSNKEFEIKDRESWEGNGIERKEYKSEPEFTDKCNAKSPDVRIDFENEKGIKENGNPCEINQDDLDSLEEGEIPESPNKIQFYEGHDDSMKEEEKIENIEIFIQRMEKTDEELQKINYQAEKNALKNDINTEAIKSTLLPNEISTLTIVNSSDGISSNTSTILRENHEIECCSLSNSNQIEENDKILITQSNVINSLHYPNENNSETTEIQQKEYSDKPISEIVFSTSERDISDESVHLTNIDDSLDDDAQVMKISAENQDRAKELKKKIQECLIESEHEKSKKSFSVKETESKLNNVDESKNNIICLESPKKKNPLPPVEGEKSPSKAVEICPNSRVILQEIDSTSEKCLKTNEIHLSYAPKEKENSAAAVGCTSSQINKVIVVARRRKVRLTDSSMSMTVVVSAKNDTAKQ